MAGRSLRRFLWRLLRTKATMTEAARTSAERRAFLRDNTGSQSATGSAIQRALFAGNLPGYFRPMLTRLINAARSPCPAAINGSNSSAKSSISGSGSWDDRRVRVVPTQRAYDVRPRGLNSCDSCDFHQLVSDSFFETAFGYHGIRER